MRELAAPLGHAIFHPQLSPPSASPHLNIRSEESPAATISSLRCRLICLQRKRKLPLGACDQLARRANQ
jgi:hypothetical protein